MLKNVLSLLLSKFYSKNESALVARQALPNVFDGTSVTLPTGQFGQVIAPFDGYLNVTVDVGGNVNIWSECLQVSNFPAGSDQAKVFVPVEKGNKVEFYINGTILISKFYKLVGGGYKLLRNLFFKEAAYA